MIKTILSVVAIFSLGCCVGATNTTSSHDLEYFITTEDAGYTVNGTYVSNTDEYCNRTSEAPEGDGLAGLYIHTNIDSHYNLFNISMFITGDEDSATKHSAITGYKGGLWTKFYDELVTPVDVFIPTLRRTNVANFTIYSDAESETDPKFVVVIGKEINETDDDDEFDLDNYEFRAFVFDGDSIVFDEGTVFAGPFAEKPMAFIFSHGYTDQDTIDLYPTSHKIITFNNDPETCD